MIGVLVDADGKGPERHFYAVAKLDRARAEWAAVDRALAVGPVAASPQGGMEPVQAIRPLTAQVMSSMGLSGGEVRALGPKWPRRWIGQP